MSKDIPIVKYKDFKLEIDKSSQLYLKGILFMWIGICVLILYEQLFMKLLSIGLLLISSVIFHESGKEMGKVYKD